MTTSRTVQKPVYSQPSTNNQPAGNGNSTQAVGDELVRIDSKNQLRPHFRAQQLTEFTSWLTEVETTAPSTPQTTDNEPVAPQTNVSTAIDDEVAYPSEQQSFTRDKRYRVDAPAGVNPPKLPRQNYVADPEEIRRIISKLKSDGRVLADREQVVESPQGIEFDQFVAASTSMVSFDWPSITASLLGSPAILNLELNIDRPGQRPVREIAITSTQVGAGATTIAMSLARQLAGHGARVLLVDANISNAALTHRLGVGASRSWIQSLSTRSSISELVWLDENSNIAMLPMMPLTTSVSWPRKILTQLSRLVDPIELDYDVIIYDTGEYRQLLSECESPASLADITLLVHGENLSTSSGHPRALRQLADTGISQLLVVKNFSRVADISNAKVG